MLFVHIMIAKKLHLPLYLDNNIIQNVFTEQIPVLNQHNVW